eukprot:1068470-Rhodomonas_salina.1
MEMRTLRQMSLDSPHSHDRHANQLGAEMSCAEGGEAQQCNRTHCAHHNRQRATRSLRIHPATLSPSLSSANRDTSSRGELNSESLASKKGLSLSRSSRRGEGSAPQFRAPNDEDSCSRTCIRALLSEIPDFPATIRRGPK